MRRIQCRAVIRAARRLTFAGAGATLAIGLLAALAPVSHASVSQGRPGATPSPAIANAARAAFARLMAERSARGGRGLRSAEPVTGVITGFVQGVARTPFTGACVTAMGPAGGVTAASGPNGRYVLAGLRPGRYTLRIGGCPGGGQPGPRAPISAAWPNVPVAVTVLPSHVTALPPAIAWPTGSYSLTGGRAPAWPAVARAKTGSISGRVTGHGRPLANICAVAIPAFAYQNGPEPHATTSKTGQYRIRGLRPGRYLVLFRTGLAGCPSNANWLPQWFPFLNSTYPPDNAANVRVRAGRTTGHIDGRLKLGGEIAGTVRSKSGKPVRGICVSFFTFAFGNGVYIVNVASVSGKTGHYALRGLFPGSYQVQFVIGCGTKGDYAPQWWRDKTSPFEANSINIRGRQIVRGIDAAMPPGAAITGTVRAKTARGRPLAGVCVYGSGNNLGDSTSAVTAKNGTYRLEGLYPGKVQVSFDPTCEGVVITGYLPAQRTVTAKAGHIRTGVNAYLHLGGGISGVIRGPNGAPADPCVTVVDNNEDFTIADARGRYLIDGVPPGKYAVFFDSGCDSSGSLAPQWYNNKPDDGSANLVTFTAGKIDHINATLHPGGTLTGVLRSPAGKPIVGDCVDLLSPQAVTGLADPTGDDMTDDNGRYFMNDLPPGVYQLSFGCGYVYRFPSQWFRSKPDSSSANYLAIDPGVTTTVDQTVGLAGIIKGKVTDKAGRPIPSICVNVANARDGQFVTPIDSGAVTNHGRYQVGQLAPGRYLVQFTDCNASIYGSQWYRGKNTETFATPVTVRARQATVGINGVLTIGGTISGRVTGPGGKPAGGVCVSAFDPAAASFEGFTSTSKSGRYVVTGLSTGRYEVTFYSCYQPSPDLASITLPKRVRVVAPRGVTGINVRLAAGGRITGTVIGDSTEPGPQGQACVLTVPTNPNGSSQLTWTDPSGRYVLDALAAGSYRVYLEDPLCDAADGLPALAPQWFRNQPDQPTANLVTVKAGRTVGGVSAILRSYGGIEGTVTTGAHAGVGGECVAAVPFHATADPITGLAPTPDIAITRPTGRYELIDLTPGKYKIEFTTGCGDNGFATQWWPRAASAKSAQVITVSNETITGIDATLRR